MTKTATPTADDLLDDIEVVEDDTPAPDPTVETWNGRSTRIKLAHPLVRNHTITGPGEPCMDCGAEGHQLHVRASRNQGRSRWLGPESEHVQALQDLGMIAGTPEEKARAARQAEIDLKRGTQGSPDRPDGFPEYKELTTARLKSQWRDVLKNGVEGLMDVEKSQVREEAALLRAAVKDGMSDLADAIREALQEAKTK
jgi:hypothetical protein